ncbi:MAG: TetR/AcrR family transcriptional regulator [Lachnospiraceae bacterium]|nr:TetR/AcrR family transcriptional regulator [Lachnospiraceae bacterium]
MMEDRRSRKSVKAIEDSFFSLIEECDISKISVTEICRRADINRSTFYAHYEDLNQFLDSLEIKIADKLYECTKQYHYDKESGAFMDAMFQLMMNNRHLFSFMFRKDACVIIEPTRKDPFERLSWPGPICF